MFSLDVDQNLPGEKGEFHWSPSSEAALGGPKLLPGGSDSGRRRFWSDWLGLVAGAALMVAATGCKTVPNTNLQAFSAGLTSAQTQSDEAFHAVNQMIADVSLDHAARQPHLLEADFSAGLDPGSIQIWDDILAKIGKYAQHIAALTSPDVAKSFDDEAVNLSGELKNFGDHLQSVGVSQVPQLNPSLATGFTTLGELIIRYRAQARALEVLASTDQTIANIFETMADAIGPTQTNGIRGTVAAHWTQLLAEKKVAFLTADQAGKRQLASDFRDLLDRKATQDLVLVSLRHSLLQLRDLHHALAQGQPLTAQAAADAISDEIKRTRDLNDRFTAQLQKQ
jgi:hypothetical protein